MTPKENGLAVRLRLPKRPLLDKEGFGDAEKQLLAKWYSRVSEYFSCTADNWELIPFTPKLTVRTNRIAILRQIQDVLQQHSPCGTLILDLSSFEILRAADWDNVEDGWLGDWIRQGYVNGVAVSMQAVLHELKHRSRGFLLEKFLNDVISDFNPFYLFFREPCAPDKNWAGRVRISVRDVSTWCLFDFADCINAKLKMDDKPTIFEAVGLVEMSGALAVECLEQFHK